MSAKTVSIIQSNYIPWRGYFDLIQQSDEVIFFDEVQYTRRDWRNRNRIKTAQGSIWLTIPVESKGHYHQPIQETRVNGHAWREQHWQTLYHHYKSTPGFSTYASEVETLYKKDQEPFLSKINFSFISYLCGVLDISTTLLWSSDFPGPGRKSERLLSLCLARGATTYLSGPAAQAYLDESVFSQNNIAVRWMDYDGYPDYPQRFPPFDPFVSVLDLLFNVGNKAKDFISRKGASYARA